MLKHINASLNERHNLPFRPDLYAIEALGVLPSTIQIEDLDIPIAFLEKVLSVGKNSYKSYENVDPAFTDNIDKLDLIMDDLCVMLPARKNFLEHADVETAPEMAVYFNLSGEPIYTLNSKSKVFDQCTINIYYDTEKVKSSDLKDFLTTLFEHVTIVKQDVVTDESYINLVTTSSSGLDIEDFKIKDPKINIALAYGEEFVKIDKNIFKTICKSDKGIWIFHGPPGSGKSMYIRNLIKRLNKSVDIENVIYMSSEMIAMLETPEFIPFIKRYKDSVLVIEDADVALESRSHNGSIVKTILQLTDGILADCLRLKIIATFNCELSKIDPALLRKGRLQIRHEFRHLTRDEALKLGAKLKIDPSIFETDEYKNKREWTLAEIYNIEQDFYWEAKKKKLGF